MAETIPRQRQRRLTGRRSHQVIVQVNEEAHSTAPTTATGGSAEPPMARIERRRSRRSLGNGAAATCDTSVVEMRCRDGEPLSVGRSRRTVPPAIRRALEARDGGCASRAAPTACSSTPITSNTGPTAARPRSTTLSSLPTPPPPPPRGRVLDHQGRDRKTSERARPGTRAARASIRLARTASMIEPAPAVPRSHPGTIMRGQRGRRHLDPGPDALNADTAARDWIWAWRSPPFAATRSGPRPHGSERRVLDQPDSSVRLERSGARLSSRYGRETSINAAAARNSSRPSSVSAPCEVPLPADE